MEDIDRENFYYPLKNCKTLQEIKNLIDNIDNDDLLLFIKDKYKQFFEFNKHDNVDINMLIIILESAYLDFVKNSWMI